MRGKYSVSPRARSGRAALALLALGIAASALACSRRERQAGPAGQGAPRAALQGEEPRPAEKRQAGQPKSPPAAARPPKLSLSASIRAFGLGAPGLARLPEDFSLGPLQDLRAAGGPEAEVLSVAGRFIKAYAAGKLEPELLYPDSREALALLLAPAGAVTPGGLPGRLGAIAVEGSSATLRLRLPSSPGEERVEGSLALGLVDGVWYVEALGLDPQASGPLSFDPDRAGAP
ncbi:MAG TPA: hypothetical protein PLB91_08105 [Spirochaetales bacterium]|nr:hypothetical protein [Spirochaetales bacterium]HRY54114.1 hypothetical protein [Spirochaetia bacterium]HRZ64076.1 hypothetical protein [Spirochaetia bacterium]